MINKLLLGLIIMSILTLMDSCSKEFLEVDRGIADFEKEARLYFEQNASDIQVVQIGKAKEHLAKSINIRSRVIRPDWKKSISVKHGAVSTLEVPLNGEVYSKSWYTRKVADRGFENTLTNVEIKLIIQKHDKINEFRYFIVTLIGRDDNGRSSRKHGYLNSRNFSGLMIFSDVEGNYLDCYQFTGGNKQRVRLARTTGEKNIRPEHVVSSFNLIDENGPGVYLRGGEGGGGTSPSYCAICHSQNCDGECEVVVTYCGECNRPAERCACCWSCKKYPCVCFTPPPPDWRCPYCSMSFCPGNCQTGGGGGGGGSGEIPSVSPQGMLSKTLFSNYSRLTSEQWQQVEDILNNINNDCMGGNLLGSLAGKNIQLIHDGGLSGSGSYNHQTKQLRIKRFDDPRQIGTVEATLLHELIHGRQTHNPNAKLNLEIEAFFAVYRYALRNASIALVGDEYQNIITLNEFLDPQYNVIEDGFNDVYESVIGDIKKIGNYSTYPESSSARNFSTVKELLIDCEQ